MHGVHPIRSARFFNSLFGRLDIMHIFDNKGVTNIALGGTLFLLVRHPGLGSSQQARMDFINLRLKKWNSEHYVSSTLTEIRLENITPGTLAEWSLLSGSMMKAAVTRHLSPFVASLSNDFFVNGNGDNLDRLRGAANDSVNYLCMVYDTLYCGDCFLSPTQLERLHDACNGFAVSVQIANSFASMLEHLIFQFTPKVHMVCHIPRQSSLISSARTQNYLSESFVGKVSRIWHGSVSGPWQRQVQSTVALKYLVCWASECEL